MKRPEEMQIVDIDELIPYVNNSRIHSKEQIKKLRSSLREFGFVNPILIDREKNILAGHGRVMAAKEEGIDSIPCVMVEHLSEAQKKAYIIADNKLALDAGWDKELLALELESLRDMDFNVEFTGFDAAEIDDLFTEIHDKDVKEDDFDVDGELEQPPISKQGDVWILGRHKIICGDSTKGETFEKLLEDRKVNLVVTDPPYGVDYNGSQGTIQNDNLGDEEFYCFLYNAFVNVRECMVSDASIYVFHAETKGLIFRKAFRDAEFHLSGVCQWVKQSLVLGRAPYQWKNEPCLFGWKKNGKHKWYAGRKETTIWNFDKTSNNKLHSTMKPIALIAYPIKNSTAVNGVVLEPFSGSGSTLIACEQIDRICYAVELEEKFVDVAVKRYIEHVGKVDDVFLIRDDKKIPYKDAENMQK